ncbi:MAG: methionine--tRNA ligase [Chloroherpetonaceae bacterium]|nr:methionine--tRNA ligase [Chloroherpetonaceae bacterium]
MTQVFKRTLVTTALPYANGPLHLGHLAGTFIPADIFVRYKKLRGEEIIHIGGSDEHGVPITLLAEKEGLSPQAIVDRYHNMQKEVLAKLNIELDNFSRTSLPIHHDTTQEFFRDIEAKGIFVKKTEKQFYDEKSQKFLADRYVVGTCPVCGNTEANGDQCENCGTYLSPQELINPKSKLTGETPILKETMHWYFPLGRYQKALEEMIDDREKNSHWRHNVLNYTREWLRRGLGDRAITRDMAWGVPVPSESSDAKGKVIYVWFDAVLGYISSTKEWAHKIGQPEKWREYWLQGDTRLIHFIGKDNVVFHALMFPAMLMAKNEANSKEKYVLVDQIPASEFINIEGKKFSKSRGYAVYAHEFLEKFPADTLRYMIAINYPENRDTDFSWNDFQNRINGELADTLGNFVKRAVDFSNSRFAGEVQADITPEKWNSLGIDWNKIREELEANYEGVHIKEAAFLAMEVARTANKFLTDSEPWKVIKSNPEAAKESLAVSLNLCFSLSMIFYPILPQASQAIQLMLGVSPSEIEWYKAFSPSLKKGHKLSGKTDVLFKKIEDKDIAPELEKIAALIKQAEADDLAKSKSKMTTEPKPEAAPVAAVENPYAIKPEITIDDFDKIDLRVATVLACEKVLKADKLLKLTVKIGDSERVILSGIAEHYTPETLIGKNIVVVANLAPRKMRGIESHGMLLAVEGEDGKVNVVFPSGESINGRRVK